MNWGLVRERTFKWRTLTVGAALFPYQVALGISVSWLRCNGSRLLRVYLGPFKFWLNGPPLRGTKT